ncbi:hypothetical protein GCM10011348_21180 [Marinobacterium nitratireducens]|uniref:Intracellular sulfur oxidation DsrE/DsrF family protein n=1 Tax=Marinobacterium nitratireducens TaxID=518897 RepID=A0A917ZEQ7_9GAMM|nr:hypothetical protein [Marinobacterium nitratireducens]GGO81666.1 hypothetical protein GCM10011348_21180 [Marinobacterium nitratireducens]
MIQLMIHAPTEAALARAQSNARNLLKLEPDAQVEIVVNGPAAAAAVKIDDEAVLPLLVLCRNSLVNQNLAAPASVRTVPAAVLHIAQQQGAGWAYLRA